MKYEYTDFVWRPLPSRVHKYDDTLGSWLNDYASEGWRLFTVRRMREKPFELLVIMEHKVPAKRKTKRNKSKR